VKPFRRFCFLLLLLAFLIPLNVAWLYFDYYSQIELRVRKNLSSEDNESLLVLFKKNPRNFYAPVASVQNQLISFLEFSFSSPAGIFITRLNNPVLRC